MKYKKGLTLKEGPNDRYLRYWLPILIQQFPERVEIVSSDGALGEEIYTLRFTFKTKKLRHPEDPLACNKNGL